jgi:hypothetical protein
MSLTSYRAAPSRAILLGVLLSGRFFMKSALEDLAATDFPTS